MSEDRQERLASLAESVMEAILATCRASDGTAYIDPDLASQALVVCLASIIEADGAVQTRRQIRESSENVARTLRLQIEALRKRFEQTGAHPGWDARAASIQ